jgi:hypothetical protein
MQSDPVVSKASELLRLGLMLSVQEIKDGKVSWIPNAHSMHCAQVCIAGLALHRHLQCFRQGESRIMNLTSLKCMPRMVYSSTNGFPVSIFPNVKYVDLLLSPLLYASSVLALALSSLVPALAFW